MSTNGTPRWRRIVGAVLLVVGCVLVPVSLSAVWVRNTLLDTDNYVSTVGPLADDPAVQQAIANRVTDALFANVDVEKKVADALPPRAGFLATPVANGIRTGSRSRHAALGRVGPVRDALGEGEPSRPRSRGQRADRRREPGDDRGRHRRHRHRPDRREREGEARRPGHHRLRRRRTAQRAVRALPIRRPGRGAGPGRSPPDDRVGAAVRRAGLLRRRDRAFREPTPHRPARCDRRRLRGRGPDRPPEGGPQPLPRRGDDEEVDAGCCRLRCGTSSRASSAPRGSP